MAISLGIPANFDARGVGVDTHYQGEVKTASGIILPPPPPIPDPPGSWDVANMVNAGVFDIGVGGETAYNIFIEPSGVYLFWTVAQSNVMHRVTMLQPWNALSIDMGTIQTYSVTLNTYGVSFNLTGNIMITTDDNNRFVEHSFTNPYDLNTALPTGKTASTSITGVNATTGLHILRSGNRAFVGKFTPGEGNIYSYTLNNFDINTILWESSNLLPQLYIGQRVYQPYIKEDGARLFMVANANTNFDNIDLTQSFNFPGAVIGNTFSLPSTSSYGSTWKPDGSRVFVTNTGSLIYQYDVGL